ncbi:hypothetical protein V6N13_102582 [Hibiscus sabdariffa]
MWRSGYRETTLCNVFSHKATAVCNVFSHTATTVRNVFSHKATTYNLLFPCFVCILLVEYPPHSEAKLCKEMDTTTSQVYNMNLWKWTP